MLDHSRLKELILEDERFNRLSSFEEVLFHRILICGDDDGWITGHPEELKPILFPKWDVRPSQIKAALRKLFSEGLLSTAQCDGRTSVRPICWDWQTEAAKPKPKAVGTQMSKAMEARFDRFWAVYPRKVGKGAARRKFAQLKPDDALTDRMIQAVEKAKQSQQWTRDGGQYVPHPTTWLNQERWEDDIQPAQERDVTLLYDQRLEDWD